jgi:uncharacterized protein (DUF488 family)
VSIVLRSILTIGHSTQTREAFLGLLRKHEVTAIADVRSVPFSRAIPLYNRNTVRDWLKEAGVAYVFLGRELGARPKDPACYVDGRVDYRRLAGTDAFRTGIRRIVDGMQRHVIAIMCAEREPTRCHRGILIARELEHIGPPVSHILGEGALESHAEMMARLVASLKLDGSLLFGTPTQRVEEAYVLQERRIAYVVRGPVAEDLVS